MSVHRESITADKPCLPPDTADQRTDLLTKLLRNVSRSFYLTLRVLPLAIRPQISLAYLLARASDTIADTKAVPRMHRLTVLRQFRPLTDAAELGPLSVMQTSDAERLLLEQLPGCLVMLETFTAADQQRIRQLLDTIVGGQIFDLERFPGESAGDIVALTDDTELDRYTYLVAGCVGEFWTAMCQAHLAGLDAWKNGRMEGLGIRFGKGLQLVNVLRDLPKDLRIGRCYLPLPDPKRLLDPGTYPSIRDEYQRWLDVALGHLEAGWQYTMNIPSPLGRVRLACIWPIWIGLMTIARLRRDNPLDPTRRIKISRGEVYGVVLKSWLRRNNATALSRTYDRLLAAAQQPESTRPH